MKLILIFLIPAMCAGQVQTKHIKVNHTNISQPYNIDGRTDTTLHHSRCKCLIFDTICNCLVRDSTKDIWTKGDKIHVGPTPGDLGAMPIPSGFISSISTNLVLSGAPPVQSHLVSPIIDSLTRLISDKDLEIEYYRQFRHNQSDTILYLRAVIEGMRVKRCKIVLSPNPKWRQIGWSEYKESITNEYALVCKDSTSVSITVGDCNCSVYTELGETGKRSCKGLKRHYLETKYWNIIYSVTTVNGVVIARDKPHWETNSSQFDTTQGVYMINGKQVYPAVMWCKGKAVKVDYLKVNMVGKHRVKKRN